MKNLLATMCLCVSLSAAADTFVFTAIPDQDETALRSRFNQIADHLKAKLTVDVKYVSVKSYAAAVTTFGNNQAQGAEDKSFQTYLIAHVSTGLNKSANLLKSIARKTFTYGSKRSTSDRLIPEFFIRKNMAGASDKMFRRVSFSGDRSRTIALVQSSAFRVSAINFAVWDKKLAASKIDGAKVKAVWVTRAYPDYNWSIRGDADKRFGARFTAKVRSALLSLDNPKLLKQFPRKSFILASNVDY